MGIRRAVSEDMEKILSIIADARRQLTCMGIDQWQGDYPDEASLLHDMEKKAGYVAFEDYRITGYAAILEGDDPTYRIIEGSWLQTGKYVTVHRLAVSAASKGRGVGAELLHNAAALALQQGAQAVRADTHEENLPMRHLLEKHGFRLCGTIRLSDGSPRLAYEKILG